jgi:signal transduction histidine kinase/ActR/RegA family two-component response regulator
MNANLSTPPQAAFAWKWFNRLSLRGKTLVIGAGFILLVLALGAGIHQMGRQGFNRVEAQYLRDHVVRVNQVLSHSASAMERYVHDYAVWDDSFNFITKPNEKYLEDNFSLDTLANLQVTHALVFDRNLRLVAGRSLEPGQDGTRPVDPRVVEQVAPVVARLYQSGKTSLSGFLQRTDHIYLVAAGQIYPTGKTQPPNGAFVHLRRLDHALIQEWSSVLRVEMALKTDADTRALVMASVASSETGFAILEGTSERLCVGIPIHDLRQQTIAVMETYLPRDIQQQARRFINLVWIMLCAALLAIGILWPLTMRWFVLKRLEQIQAFVAKLGRTRTLTDRLPVREGDELDALAIGVNQTLDALETEQRLRGETEKGMQRLQEQLIQVQKMEALATMAGGIAHDFNNSLSAIMGSIELMKDELPEDHASQKHLARMQKAGSGACALAKQMLNLSRTTPMQKSLIHLGDTISEVLRLVRAGLPKSIEIQFLNSALDDVVLADAMQLQQVIMNLATNASHAMANQPSGLIEVSLREVILPASDNRQETLTLQAGSYIRLDFSDSGHGIPKELLSRVFDPFFTTKPTGSGTGLGLAVAHGFAARHGGSLGIESELGRGTTFILHLPKHRLPEGTLAHGSGGLKILLVDDDTHGRETLAAGLRRNGHDVTEAANGDQALKRITLDAGAFDVVVTDQIMPGMTGMDLCRELRGSAPQLPVVLISGYTGPMDASLLAEKGIVDFLIKPVSFLDLEKALRKVRRPSPEA